MLQPIETYIINLKSRPDRREHVLSEFANRDEFSVHLVEPITDENPRLSLWNTIKHIITSLIGEEHSYVLICEDDHIFTPDYNKNNLHSLISEAAAKNADVWAGGVSSVIGCIKITPGLYWGERFSGTQFIVLFRKFFDTIINAPFNPSDTADYKICSLTNNKYFVYPFISTQKGFGYSDVTPRNSEEVDVEELFRNTAENIRILNNVSSFYESNIVETTQDELLQAIESACMPTYIINIPERVDRRLHILGQFNNKPEFDVKIIDACKNDVGALGLWMSLRKVIQMAIDNDDDVIIVCEDDHEFTKDYSRDYLLRNIIEAHEQGIEYLSGGTSKYTLALPVSENRFWVSSCLATQFIVLYKNIFQKILDQPFDHTIVADQMLSAIAYNKMVLYPSVSIQKDFGYSDITSVHNERPTLVSEMFAATNARLQAFRESIKSLKLLQVK